MFEKRTKTLPLQPQKARTVEMMGRLTENQVLPFRLLEAHVGMVGHWLPSKSLVGTEVSHYGTLSAFFISDIFWIR